MDAPWTVAHVERPGRAAAPRAGAGAGQRRDEARPSSSARATVVLTGDDIVTAGRRLLRQEQRHPAGHRQVARQPLARGARPLVRQRHDAPAPRASPCTSSPSARPSRAADACARRRRASPAPGAATCRASATSPSPRSLAWYLDRTLPRLRPRHDLPGRGADCGGAAGPAAGAAGGRAGVPGLQLPLPRAALLVRHRLADRHPDAVRLPGRWRWSPASLAGRVRDQQQATARRAAAITRAAGRQPPALGLGQEARRGHGAGRAALGGHRRQGDDPAAHRRRRDRAGRRRARRWRRSPPRTWPPRAGPGSTARRPAPAPAPCRNAGWTFWPLQGIAQARRRRRASSRAPTPTRSRERFVLSLLDQGAIAARARRARRRGGGGRRPAPLRAAAHGAAELHQPRPADAAGGRAGRGDDADRVWPGAGAAGAGPTCWRASATRPSGSTATSATCST